MSLDITTALELALPFQGIRGPVRARASTLALWPKLSDAPAASA
jgi:hypothetical protein